MQEISHLLNIFHCDQMYYTALNISLKVPPGQFHPDITGTAYSNTWFYRQSSQEYAGFSFSFFQSWKTLSNEKYFTLPWNFI